MTSLESDSNSSQVRQIQQTPYLDWDSPITPKKLTEGQAEFFSLRLNGGNIFWEEARPEEDGRRAVIKRTPDKRVLNSLPIELKGPNNEPFSARTKGHEYGGRAYLAIEDTLFFSNYEDQRIYCKNGDEIIPITPEGKYYSDMLYDFKRKRIIAVEEDHTKIKEIVGGTLTERERNSKEVVNRLVSLDPSGNLEPQVLAQGQDFYASPALSPDGDNLAWISWDHPNMPWDDTTLHIGKFRDDGSLEETNKIEGNDESIMLPQWSPGGDLYFVSDRSNWWNIYRLKYDQIQAVHIEEAEYGFPQWNSGTTSYGFTSDTEIVAAANKNGVWELQIINTETGQAKKVQSPYTDIDAMYSGIQVSADQILFAAGSSKIGKEIVSFNAHTLEYEVVAKSTEAFDAGYLSEPELIQFPTENGNVAFGFFYAPKNKDYEPTKGEKPPLIVKIHGGPTYAARTLFNKEVQFWTSHGFAVFDVNYGGSTGYGRAFRKRLNGNWGIVDIDDAVNGSKFLAEQGKVDGEKMVITGESAGGYTTLTSLAFRDVFAAGASYYGISDLSALVGETHKFESRYLDRLVGPYPKMKSVYDERSAMSHVDGINVPLIIFQGMKDPIVPPNQAEKIRDAVKAHGQPVEFYTYEDESHGFVKASTIQHSRTKELEFYRRVLR